MDYNFKVVAKLKPDLDACDRSKAEKVINDSMIKLKIVRDSDGITYHKQYPIRGFDDFGAVAFFYVTLEDKAKQYLQQLEYYELKENYKDVAV